MTLGTRTRHLRKVLGDCVDKISTIIAFNQNHMSNRVKSYEEFDELTADLLKFKDYVQTQLAEVPNAVVKDGSPTMSALFINDPEIFWWTSKFNESIDIWKDSENDTEKEFRISMTEIVKDPEALTQIIERTGMNHIRNYTYLIIWK